MRRPSDSWNPFARRRARAARVDAAVATLERAAAAAEAERERLAEAVEVSRQALLALHRALSDWAGQPARAAAATARLERVAIAADDHAERLLGSARADLRAAVAVIGEGAAERVAAEIAPARAAAEAHADYLRASLDRMRGEAQALGGAQDAIAALSATAQGAVLDAVDVLVRRSARAGNAAERAADRLAAASERLEAPKRRVRSR